MRIPSLTKISTTFAAGKVKLTQQRSYYSGTDLTKDWRRQGSVIAGAEGALPHGKVVGVLLYRPSSSIQVLLPLPDNPTQASHVPQKPLGPFHVELSGKRNF